MRNFLNTSDIARLSGYSRAQVWNWWKAGLIPARNINTRGKRLRFIDSPEIRLWCEIRLTRLNPNELKLAVIEAAVLDIILRDCSGDLERVIVPEILRQLRDSKDPDQLLKKWERAMAERRPDDLPHVDLAYAGRDAFAEICRQLRDSKNRDQLLKEWGWAIVDRSPDDLPRVL